MALLTVGPNSSYPTIAAAMLAAGANDTIQLETGYSNETATVTFNGMIVSGDATSTGIILQLGAGIATFTLAGAAPINVLDAVDGDGIVGNAGNNIITVTDGADAVDGGLETDRLIVDYRLATGAVTGDSTTNFDEAGTPRIVTITNGTFEHFTVLTGSGADTITTGAGDDIINTGEGAGTVTAGQGANSITGGGGADTITALDGGNFIDGRDGTNTLTSGGGNDVIIGGVDADTIIAGGGNDVVTVRGGADTSDGGAGNDRLVVDYSALNTAVSGGVTGGDLLIGYTGHFADLAGSSIGFQGTESFTITTGSGNDVITTGDGSDVLNGGLGNDLLDGGGGSDTINGGAGTDTLSGGAGDDRWIYTVGGGADTVTDFLAGANTEDKVDLTAFTDIHTLGDVLTRATQVGSDTVLNFGSGDTLTLQGVLRSNLVGGDFVLAPNNAIELQAAFAPAGQIGSEWAVAGVADFGGSPTGDVMWTRGSTGSLALWTIEGGALASAEMSNGSIGGEWSVAGTGDFNGDGHNDIVWSRGTGDVAIWQMNGAAVQAAGIPNGKMGAEWNVTGAGDFNGDGKDDLVWTNASGQAVLWSMAALP